jgi:hypothetical protein
MPLNLGVSLLKTPFAPTFPDVFTFSLICKTDQGAYYQRENTDASSQVSCGGVVGLPDFSWRNIPKRKKHTK